MILRLCDAYREPTSLDVLYALLKERPVESRISHEAMPPYSKHARFVRSHPYRFWFLVKAADEFVGDLHVTRNNEIGIFIFTRHRGNGYGAQAVQTFMRRHRPRAAIAAVRVNKWLAHVSPENEAGASFFGKLGFKLVQRTFAYG